MDDPKKIALGSGGKMSPEIAALAEELRRNLLAAFCALYCESKEQGIKALSSRAGLSSTYLHKVFNGTRKLTLDVLLQVVAASNDPLERIFRRYVRSRPGTEGLPETPATHLGSPAELLEDWREKPEKKDSFLIEVEGWVVEIGRRGTDTRPAAAPLKQVVLSLEEERLRDWRWLKQQLEERGRDQWRELTRKDRLPRAAIAEIGVLVAAWAAAQRVAGFRGNAIDALRCAFELAELAEDSWTKAFCLQKAAYLAHDFGHDAEALIFVQRATLLLAEAPTVEDLARNTVDRGYFYYQNGNRREAERLISSGLAKLGPQQRLYRFTAHQALALLAREEGQLSKAREEIRAAADYCSGEGLEAAYVAWTAAGIEQEAGASERAVEYLREAMLLFAQHGRAGDIAFAALDLIAILLVLDRWSELSTLAVEVLGWLGPLAASNSCLLEVFEDIAALLQLGTLKPQHIEAAKNRCESDGSWRRGG